MLANSPPLPLVIYYLDARRDITAEDEKGLFLALKQPNRIRCIRIKWSLHRLEEFVEAIDHELPFLEYLVIMATEEDRIPTFVPTFVFSEIIQAPRLRHLVLVRIAPKGSRLLTTAVGLVTLCLYMDYSSDYIKPVSDSSTFINPDSLLHWISPLSQLETLEITTYPNRRVETQVEMLLSHTLAITPNLRMLSFKGVSAYLDVLISQITMPRLETLCVTLLVERTISIPCLVRFVNAAENERLRFDSAKFEFSNNELRLVTYPHEKNRGCSFSISVDCRSFSQNIFHMSHIVYDMLGQAFSTVEHLTLDLVGLENGLSYGTNFSCRVGRIDWYKL